MYTQNGRWRHTGEAWTHWCDGFLPGMMWTFHRRTRDAEWSRLAERYTTPLEPRKMDRNVHDLGFIFLSTYHRWYRLTGEKALNDVVIQAGQTLALRFKEKGEYMCSFMGPDSLFIDIMANVGIIFYAALQTEDEKLLDVAIRHCLTTRRVLIRGTAARRMRACTTSKRVSSFGRRRSKVIAEIRAGHAGWRGRFTVSARHTTP